ncbi:D-2-hydroxyacid dehydrogenase [Candidatus Neomarinimicrobiota bacterium]
MKENDHGEPLRVLLVTRFPELHPELERLALPGIHLERTKDDTTTGHAIAQAEIILADPPLIATHLDRASELKWLQSTWAGVDAIFRINSRRDYLLTRVQGLFGPLMAEYILGHIIARERGVVTLAEQQQERIWKPEIRYRRLSTLTLGVLGLGEIGSAVARTAKAFGMTVWGLRTRDEPVPGVDRIFTPDRLDEFLAGPDYLANTLPSTPLTQGLLSGGILQDCQSTAVFMNVGRGDVVDETSLVTAMREGWISGAVLDVFPEEPLPPESPLWDLPNVTVTPHVAAYSFPDTVAEIFATNLVRYQSGEPLLYQVDWERGY